MNSIDWLEDDDRRTDVTVGGVPAYADGTHGTRN